MEIENHSIQISGMQNWLLNHQEKQLLHMILFILNKNKRRKVINKTNKKNNFKS